MNADPTMTASANPAIWAACSPVRTPSPTPIGRSVSSRQRATSDGAADETWSRAPVTPMVDAAYRKPRVAAAVRLIRSADDEGATRKIGSMPFGAGGGQPRLGLVDDQVRRDDPGAAGRGQVTGEVVDAVGQDRVEVGHHHGPPAGGRDPLDDAEDVAEAKPVAAGRFRGVPG